MATKNTVEDTFDVLVAKLPVISENIIEEAIKQPTLFITAARYRVEKMRERSQVSAELDATRAEMATSIRNKKNNLGEKITEGALKELLEQHSAIVKLRRLSDRAYEAEELSKLLLEAIRMRRDAIKIVAEMQTYEGLRENTEIERVEQSRKLRNAARKLVDRKQHMRG